jgi:5-(carboxyamino)imidazole ribonucleotide synthase
MIVGVLGGGQLGRMLALAGYALGFRFRFLDPSPDAPAGQLGELVVGDFTDQKALERFRADLAIVTYELEQLPAASVRSLARHVPVYPPPQALEAAQDRYEEKTLFQHLGIPTPAFALVGSEAELRHAVDRIGLPAIVKTRHGGYDGKGQRVLRGQKDIRTAWEALAPAALVVEEFISFERELSLVAVRGRKGETAFYPLVENRHSNGILRLTLAPAPTLAPGLQTVAEDYAHRLLESLSYVGVLAVEFFECAARLLANEMAPRVHNSGHWTIEGAETSQFENHLRAMLGLPLGPTDALGSTGMLNLVGIVPDVARILEIGGAHLHLYGKRPAPGRKLGHVTFQNKHGAAALEVGLEQLRAVLGLGREPSEAVRFRSGRTERPQLPCGSDL